MYLIQPFLSAITVSILTITSGCKDTLSNSKTTPNTASATVVTDTKPTSEMLPSRDWNSLYRSLSRRHPLSSEEIGDVVSRLRAVPTGRIVAATLTINGYASRFPHNNGRTEYVNRGQWFRPLFPDFQTPGGKADGANWLWELQLRPHHGSRDLREKLWYEHYLIRQDYPMGDGSSKIMHTLQHNKDTPWHHTKLPEASGDAQGIVELQDVLDLASGTVTASPLVTPMLLRGLPALSLPQLPTSGYSIQEDTRSFFLLTWKIPQISTPDSVASGTSSNALSILVDQTDRRLRSLIVHNGARASLIVEYRGLTYRNGVVCPALVFAQWPRIWRETEDSKGIVLSDTITVTTTGFTVENDNNR